MDSQSSIDPVHRGMRAVRWFISLHWVRDAWMYTIRLLERMEDNHIFLSAGSLAFNTLLCFIPLILIIFYLLGIYLDTQAAILTIGEYVDSLQMIPFSKDRLLGVISRILTEFVGGSNLAGLIGAVGLIWTSSALFAALRTVLNQIYNIKDTKNLLVSKLKDLALLSIIGIVIVIITVSLNLMTIFEGISSNLFGDSQSLMFLHSTLTHGTSFVLSFLLFAIVYYVIPDTRMPWRAIAISSGIAAALWSIAKFLFGYYVTHLWAIGKVYGPYAIIVAVAIWVYYSSITVLLAAEIGEMYLERKKLKNMFKETEMKRIVSMMQSNNITIPLSENAAWIDSE